MGPNRWRPPGREQRNPPFDDYTTPHFPWITGEDCTWILKDKGVELKTDTDSLCPRCSSWDFDKIFRISQSTEGVQATIAQLRWARLDNLEKWNMEDSSCSFCNLMKYTIRAHGRPQCLEVYWTPNQFQQTYQPFSLMRLFWGDAFGDSKLVPPPFIVSSQARGTDFVRLLKHGSIDFDIITGWLRFCNEQGTCHGKYHSSSVQITNLRVIDCLSRRIVHHEGAEYVTLSYVWGSPQASTINEYTEMLPDDLPHTIADAITVTKKLGLQYLWVDRYCIDRRDQETFLAQLNQMGDIYRESVLTIVAAAGSYDSYGLPGVGCRHRRSQPRARSGNHSLVSSLSEPSKLVSESAWASRGWTFQEACLSKRKLFFTDEQVSYECRCSYHSESLNYDLLELRQRHTFSTWNGGLRLSEDLPHQANEQGKVWSATRHEMWRLVREYTQRHLTNSSDILNGFLGVLAAFKDRSLPFRHLWGIPLPPPLPEDLYHEFYSPFWRRDPQNPPSSTDESEAGFVEGLCWELVRPSLRREGFPSWSWTGWFGPIEPLRYNLKFHIFPDVIVEAELRSHQTLSWKEFSNCYDDLKQQIEVCQRIRVSAWVSPITIVMQTEGRVVARMDLMEGRFMHWTFTPTTADSLPKQKLYHMVWLYLGEHKWEPSEAPGPFVLVVTDLDDANDVVERVGLGKIWVENCTFFEATGVKIPRISGPPLIRDPDRPDPVIWSDGVWLEGPAMFPKTRRTFWLE